MKGVVVMGVFLGQLPPAEIARLKAELAETLIAHFCYPRFYDYRTNSLRTRPVDRAKRQEVWLYLSSVDFTAWSRVDLMSADFQHQIERLFIHFVQRNRSFFGEQGRKRMSDIRMLIGTSALAVAQGLRGHLTGHHQNNPPFGSPRPVSSWSTTNVTGRPEPGWEQLAQQTMVLQQQLQEIRGEIKATSVAVPNEVRSAPVVPPAPRRATRVPATPVTHVPPTPAPSQQSVATNGTRNVDHVTPAAVVPVYATKTPQHVETRNNGTSAVSPQPVSPPKSTPLPNPVPARNAGAIVAPPAQPKAEPVVPPVAPLSPLTSSESPTAPVAAVVVPVKPTVPPIPPTPASEKAQQVPPPVPVAVSPPVSQPVSPPATQATSVATIPVPHENTSVQASGEDVAIFEEMRHQLVVWLRVEAVRAGLDISNQGPTQLLDLLRQQEKRDETRLQVVSTMLNLCNQVIKNGKAGLYDYKQALIFHIMHTKQ